MLVVDDLSTGSAANLHHVRGDVEMVKVDIRDAALVRQAFDDFRPDVVFHLAARTDVRASMADPHDDASVNVLGSINVFAAAARGRGAAGREHLDRRRDLQPGGAIPTPETAPVAPLSAYGLSKRVVEEYADWFRSSSGLDVVTLRYGNVYGPRQDPTGDAGSWQSSASGCSPVAGPSSSATAPRPATSSTSPTSPRPISPRPRSRTRATASTTSAPGSRFDPRVGEGDGGGRGRRSTSRPAAAVAGPPR